ncbi:MAG: phosphoglycerate kinase [bacterium]
MKTYIVQVNLDIKTIKKAEETVRFKNVLKTIKSIAKSSNKVVIISHRGRPTGYDKELSLQPFRPLLQEAMGTSVGFLPISDLRLAKILIQKAEKGSIFLCENIRFFPGEEKNSKSFAKELAELGDFYINDDFATSHRRQASYVGIPLFLPSKLGPRFKEEITILKKVLKKAESPFVLIIGGTKISDKIGVIEKFLPAVDYILLGGGAALTLQKAAGIDIGSSIYDEKMLTTAKRLLRDNKIILPIDEVKQDDRILDIGPATVKHYNAILKTAKTIIWAGPMGLVEEKPFMKGTYEIARTIAKSNAFSIIGGGDTTKVITTLHLEDKFGFVSTGGSAMLEFLSGKELPAMTAIANSKKKYEKNSNFVS